MRLVKRECKHRCLVDQIIEIWNHFSLILVIRFADLAPTFVPEQPRVELVHKSFFLLSEEVDNELVLTLFLGFTSFTLSHQEVIHILVNVCPSDWFLSHKHLDSLITRLGIIIFYQLIAITHFINLYSHSFPERLSRLVDEVFHVRPNGLYRSFKFLKICYRSGV